MVGETKLKTDVVFAFAFGVTFLCAILAVAVFVTNPTPLLITVVKIILSVAAAGVAATIPGFIAVRFTPVASVAVRAGGAIAVFVLVFFFTPAGLVPNVGDTLPKPPSQVHTIVTPKLGLQFKQGTQILPIFDGGSGVSAVKLRREAFIISLPERTWQTREDEYPALQVTISKIPELFGLVSFSNSAEENPFFQPGTGVADEVHGSGRLFAITDLSDRPFSHNYLLGPRLNVEEFERRGFYISSIEEDSPSEANLLRTARSIYMVFHLSPGVTLKPRTLDRFRVDLVRLDFQ